MVIASSNIFLVRRKNVNNLEGFCSPLMKFSAKLEDSEITKRFSKKKYEWASSTFNMAR